MQTIQNRAMIRIKFYTACFTALSFTFTSIVFPSALHAAPEVSAKLVNIQDFSTLKIPEALAKVETVFDGDEKAGRSVIVIQDAHSIPDAQRSIRKTILFIEKEYGAKLIGVEGASGDLDTRIFQSYPDQEKLQAVFKDYMDKGEMTGSVAAAIFGLKKEMTARGAEFFGIEDWPVYEEGLALYLAAMGQQEAILKSVESQKSKVKEEKEKAYSKELLDVDEAQIAFEENSKDLLAYIKILADVKAPEMGSEIALLLNEADKGQSQDAAMEAEVRRLAAKLKLRLGHLSPAGQKVFNEKNQAFQTSQLSATQFALALKDLSDKEGFLLPMSQGMTHQAHNQRRMRDLEGTKIFKDIEAYTKDIKETLFRNDIERQLDQRTHELILLTKWAKLELSRENWREVRELWIVDSASSPSLTLPRETGEGWVGGLPSKNADMLILFKYHKAFYENAEKRDAAFIKNLEKRLKPGEPAIMIAGGFHAQGLAEHLQAKGIDYALVMPNIAKLPEVSAYREHMKGNVDWKSYFEVKNGKINLYEAFVRYTRDRLLGKVTGVGAGSKPVQEQDPLLLKNWRDEIIRDLADEGKLAKAGEYTRFIDETLQDKNKKDLEARMQDVEKFITGLKDLDAKGQFTAPNIAKLLQPVKGNAQSYKVTTAQFANAVTIINPQTYLSVKSPVLGGEMAETISPDVLPPVATPKNLAVAASEVRVAKFKEVGNSIRQVESEVGPFKILAVYRPGMGEQKGYVELSNGDSFALMDRNGLLSEGEIRDRLARAFEALIKAVQAKLDANDAIGYGAFDDVLEPILARSEMRSVEENVTDWLELLRVAGTGLLDRLGKVEGEISGAIIFQPELLNALKEQMKEMEESTPRTRAFYLNRLIGLLNVDLNKRMIGLVGSTAEQHSENLKKILNALTKIQDYLADPTDANKAAADEGVAKVEKPNMKAYFDSATHIYRDPETLKGYAGLLAAEAEKASAELGKKLEGIDFRRLLIRPVGPDDLVAPKFIGIAPLSTKGHNSPNSIAVFSKEDKLLSEQAMEREGFQQRIILLQKLAAAEEDKENIYEQSITPGYLSNAQKQLFQPETTIRNEAAIREAFKQPATEKMPQPKQSGTLAGAIKGIMSFLRNLLASIAKILGLGQPESTPTLTKPPAAPAAATPVAPQKILPFKSFPLEKAPVVNYETPGMLPSYLEPSRTEALDVLDKIIKQLGDAKISDSTIALSGTAGQLAKETNNIEWKKDLLEARSGLRNAFFLKDKNGLSAEIDKAVSALRKAWDKITKGHAEVMKKEGELTILGKIKFAEGELNSIKERVDRAKKRSEVRNVTGESKVQETIKYWNAWADQEAARPRGDGVSNAINLRNAVQALEALTGQNFKLIEAGATMAGLAAKVKEALTVPTRLSSTDDTNSAQNPDSPEKLLIFEIIRDSRLLMETVRDILMKSPETDVYMLSNPRQTPRSAAIFELNTLIEIRSAQEGAIVFGRGTLSEDQLALALYEATPLGENVIDGSFSKEILEKLGNGENVTVSFELGERSVRVELSPEQDLNKYPFILRNLLLLQNERILAGLLSGEVRRFPGLPKMAVFKRARQSGFDRLFNKVLAALLKFFSGTRPVNTSYTMDNMYYKGTASLSSVWKGLAAYYKAQGDSDLENQDRRLPMWSNLPQSDFMGPFMKTWSRLTGAESRATQSEDQMGDGARSEMRTNAEVAVEAAKAVLQTLKDVDGSLEDPTATFKLTSPDGSSQQPRLAPRIQLFKDAQFEILDDVNSLASDIQAHAEQMEDFALALRDYGFPEVVKNLNEAAAGLKKIAGEAIFSSLEARIKELRGKLVETENEEKLLELLKKLDEVYNSIKKDMVKDQESLSDDQMDGLLEDLKSFDSASDEIAERVVAKAKSEIRVLPSGDGEQGEPEGASALDVGGRELAVARSLYNFLDQNRAKPIRAKSDSPLATAGFVVATLRGLEDRRTFNEIGAAASDADILSALLLLVEAGLLTTYEPAPGRSVSKYGKVEYLFTESLKTGNPDQNWSAIVGIVALKTAIEGVANATDTTALRDAKGSLSARMNNAPRGIMDDQVAAALQKGLEKAMELVAANPTDVETWNVFGGFLILLEARAKFLAKADQGDIHTKLVALFEPVRVALNDFFIARFEAANRSATDASATLVLQHAYQLIGLADVNKPQTAHLFINQMITSLDAALRFGLEIKPEPGSGLLISGTVLNDIQVAFGGLLNTMASFSDAGMISENTSKILKILAQSEWHADSNLLPLPTHPQTRLIVLYGLTAYFNRLAVNSALPAAASSKPALIEELETAKTLLDNQYIRGRAAGSKEARDAIAAAIDKAVVAARGAAKSEIRGERLRTGGLQSIGRFSSIAGTYTDAEALARALDQMEVTAIGMNPRGIKGTDADISFYDMRAEASSKPIAAMVDILKQLGINPTSAQPMRIFTAPYPLPGGGLLAFVGPDVEVNIFGRFSVLRSEQRSIPAEVVVDRVTSALTNYVVGQFWEDVSADLAALKAKSTISGVVVTRAEALDMINQRVREATSKLSGARAFLGEAVQQLIESANHAFPPTADHGQGYTFGVQLLNEKDLATAEAKAKAMSQRYAMKDNTLLIQGAREARKLFLKLLANEGLGEMKAVPVSRIEDVDAGLHSQSGQPKIPIIHGGTQLTAGEGLFGIGRDHNLGTSVILTPDEAVMLELSSSFLEANLLEPIAFNTEKDAKAFSTQLKATLLKDMDLDQALASRLPDVFVPAGTNGFVISDDAVWNVMSLVAEFKAAQAAAVAA